MPIILVTGANRGIGLEVCRQLAVRGVTVIAASRKGTQTRHGTPVAMDVNDDAGIRKAVEQVSQTWGRIDGLVNNAAVALDKGQPILTLSRETLRATLETNVLGPMRVTQAFWPILRDGGFVVNVSSESGSLAGMDTWAPGYSLSKAALNALTVQLAIAGHERRIRVNSVCPGWVQTDMGGEEAPGTPAEGASGIVWLALDAPKGATGKFYQDRREIPW